MAKDYRFVSFYQDEPALGLKVDLSLIWAKMQQCDHQGPWRELRSLTDPVSHIQRAIFLCRHCEATVPMMFWISSHGQEYPVEMTRQIDREHLS